ncbi:hypothetical protein QQ045_009606 [Rhodiola kirilowii]
MGAWEVNSWEVGLGIVARDHLRVVIWSSWAVHWDQGWCASEVEGQALLLGMKLVRALGTGIILGWERQWT